MSAVSHTKEAVRSLTFLKDRTCALEFLCVNNGGKRGAVVERGGGAADSTPITEGSATPRWEGYF